jgi:hypothetical protein
LPARDILDEIDAIYEFHRKEPMVTIGKELIKLDEIGVLEVSQAAKLLLEAVKDVRVRLPQLFQRHFAVTLCVVRQIDDPECALAQAPLNLEALSATKLLPPETHNEKRIR